VVAVYVYYRVKAADVQAAAQALAPLGCAVSRRADNAGELVTLMERYALNEVPSPAWLAQMHARALAALGGVVQGERHTEVFMDAH
jgi:hypothetical protein